MKDIKRAVICIDDDPMILQVLGFQLEKLLNMSDLTLELYSEPLKALNDIDEFKFENITIAFLIVDYRMPTMSGATFIRQVKEKHPDVPCIMLSGQANSLQIEALEKEGLLEAFVQKPWEESELKRSIELLKNKLI